MTVQELIEKLKQLPNPNAEVVIIDANHDIMRTYKQVEIYRDDNLQQVTIDLFLLPES